MFTLGAVPAQRQEREKPPRNGFSCDLSVDYLVGEKKEKTHIAHFLYWYILTNPSVQVGGCVSYGSCYSEGKYTEEYVR